MEDKDKTKEQLIEELGKLRKQVTEFEKSGSERNNVEEKQKKQRNGVRFHQKSCLMVSSEWI